jgi:tRNA A-37 threonylcarbamoyl transferase component Bud32
MAFVETHPNYRAMLARHGLVTAGDFLALDGIVCCGHPDRHVVRVTVGKAEEAVPAFLKREHRTRWRDRLANAWTGFGLASRSHREFTLLRELEETDIGAPEPIAAGEDDDGRAFLVVRELDGYQDLRQFLRDLDTSPLAKRRDVARQLGAALARVHAAGYDHPDLYSKHVLISPAPAPQFLAFRFLDWQRSRRRPHVSWSRRWRDLAALDATLADELATPRERLIALHAYLRGCRTPLDRHDGITLAAAAHAIRKRTRRLLERRRFREMRQPPLAIGVQNLIWVDGDALVVTREFREEMGGNVPDWLRTPLTAPKNVVRQQAVPLPGTRLAHLVTRWASRPWRWLLSSLRRRPLVAPELESMNILFRLQRYGVVVPRLLAAGQRHVGRWQTQSFLLTEPLQDALPLPQFLANAAPLQRRAVLRQAAQVLRQMHQANCYFEDDKNPTVSRLLTVCWQPPEAPTVALATVQGIEKSHYPNGGRAQRDLVALARHLVPTCSQSDLLRGLLAYLGAKDLTPAVRVFAGKLLRRLNPARRRLAA